jgi:hypothetical protein
VVAEPAFPIHALGGTEVVVGKGWSPRDADLLLAQLAASGALLKDARVVDDGDLITSAGSTSGIDLALHVLDREFGPDFAVMIAGVLEFEPRGTGWAASDR